MAIIKSGATGDLLTVDPTAKAARATLYDASGAALGTAGNPLRTLESPGRTIVGEYATTTWREAGSAIAAQNLCTIENLSGSTVKLAIKRFTIQVDSTALLATVSPSIKVARFTPASTGGYQMTASKFLSSYPSAQAVVKGLTNSDGGALSGITATPGTAMWTQFLDRMHSAAGIFFHFDATILPAYVNESPLLLLPGEGLVVYGNIAIAATFMMIFNAAWEEYT